MMSIHSSPVFRFVTGLCCCVAITPLLAGDLEAFTEPSRSIQVPSAEMGVIAEFKVREGETVYRGQLLAKLDDEVLRKTLEVARTAKDAIGQKLAAEAELKTREQQVKSYRQLFDDGNATPRELQRAENEYKQSLARLQGVLEEMSIREMEFERVSCQLKQRLIVAPMDGVVVRFEKEAGEFVSPTDPIVLALVQLDELKAVFSVPLNQVQSISQGQKVVIRIGPQRDEVIGTVDFVSPLVNAESGTVAVRVRMPNQQRTIRSGVVCWLDLDASPTSTPVSSPQVGLLNVEPESIKR